MDSKLLFERQQAAQELATALQTPMGPARAAELEPVLLSALNGDERWESRHGALLCCQALLGSKLATVTASFTDALELALVLQLGHPEQRVRAVAAEVIQLAALRWSPPVQQRVGTEMVSQLEGLLSAQGAQDENAGVLDSWVRGLAALLAATHPEVTTAALTALPHPLYIHSMRAVVSICTVCLYRSSGGSVSWEWYLFVHCSV